MTICRWCKEDSKDEYECSWCGVAFAIKQPECQQLLASGWEQAVDVNQEEKSLPLAFLATCITALFVASLIIMHNHDYYFIVGLSCLFLGGVLLGQLKIIPRFNQEWKGFIFPLMCLLFLPMLLVYLGYIAYGIITRELNMTVVWLLSLYFAMLFVLQVVFVMTITDSVTMAMIIRFRGVEFLGLFAMIFGWAICEYFHPLGE